VTRITVSVSAPSVLPLLARPRVLSNSQFVSRSIKQSLCLTAMITSRSHCDTRMRTQNMRQGVSSDTLRSLLRTELRIGPCSVARIAERLQMHRRTLSRQLETEGTDFRTITAQVRFEIACKLLANHRLELWQVSSTLGYSEPSAFTRAFRRWSGKTPGAWRLKQLRKSKR
jgi:AraC-like DNA-binding protein